MRALLLKALLVVTMAIGLTPALGVTWASACKCAGGTDETFAARADTIFEGTRPVGKKGVPAFLGAGRAIETEPVAALGPSTDDPDDDNANLGWLALAGGLLIAAGTVLTVRKRRHP